MVDSIERPKDEVSPMLPIHPLATAVQADREREIRERAPRLLGVRTGRRLPTVALSIERPAPGPRVARAGGGQP